MEGLCFYVFQIPGNKGFKISCATPNWRIFLFYYRLARAHTHIYYMGSKIRHLEIRAGSRIGSNVGA